MLGACIYLEGWLHESGGLTTSVLFKNWDISNIWGAGAVGLIAWFCMGKSIFLLQHLKSKHLVTFEHIVSPRLVVCRHFLSTIQNKVRIMSPK